MGFALTPEQRALRKKLYEQTGGGEEYHRLCEQAGIPTKRNALTTETWRDIADRAHEAGRAAAEQTVPQPMTVVQHANPLDDTSRPVKQWHVPEGVCGFAWISFPGNTSFGKWAKQHLGARRGYPKGLQIWVSDYGQSYEKKMAYAKAFARVLQEAGVNARAQGRLD